MAEPADLSQLSRLAAASSSAAMGATANVPHDYADRSPQASQPPWALSEAVSPEPAARQRSPERKFFRVQAHDIRPGGVGDSSGASFLTVTAQGRESVPRKPAAAALKLLRASSPDVSQRYGTDAPTHQALITANAEFATSWRAPQPEPEPRLETWAHRPSVPSVPAHPRGGDADELWLALEDSLLSRSRRVAGTWHEPLSDAPSAAPRHQGSAPRQHSARGYSPFLSELSPRRRASSPDRSIFSPAARTMSAQRRAGSPRRAPSPSSCSSSSEEDALRPFRTQNRTRRGSPGSLFSPARDINRHTQQWRRSVVEAEKAEST